MLWIWPKSYHGDENFRIVSHCGRRHIWAVPVGWWTWQKQNSFETNIIRSWVCLGWPCQSSLLEFIFWCWFILCDDSDLWLGCRAGSGGQLSSTLGVTLAGSLALSGFDSVGQYLSKKSKWHEINLQCGLKLHWEKNLLMSACSPSLPNFIWNFSHLVWNRLIRDSQNSRESQRNFLEVKKYFWNYIMKKNVNT